MSERESLFPVVPLDRYCLAPCVEQLTEGECDCTRRIAREVEEATRRAIASFGDDEEETLIGNDRDYEERLRRG